MYCQSPTRREERGKSEKVAEIIAENFPYLARDINLQDQETKQMRNSINLKKSLPRYIIIKLFKTKNKKIYTLKETREKQYLTYREITMRKTGAILKIQTQDAESQA